MLPDPTEPAIITLHVTTDQHRVLYEFSRRKFVKQHPAVPQAAWMALAFATSHSDQFLNWASGLIRYQRAEGVDQFDFINRRISMNVKKLKKQRV
jgi:hypothetical protein